MQIEPEIVELRQYTLFGGQRDELIELFEHEFLEAQAEVGAPILGTFRDLDDPDRFVWLRGFADMAARKIALEAFYGGLVWAAHRDEANLTMLDFANVLLLRPVGPAELPFSRIGLLRVAIHSLRDTDGEAFVAFFDEAIKPLIEASGGEVMQRYLTEESPNTFTRLPVRENDPVFVWTAAFANDLAESRFSAALAQFSGWRDQALLSLLPALRRKPEVLRLVPTERSPLR